MTKVHLLKYVMSAMIQKEKYSVLKQNTKVAEI